MPRLIYQPTSRVLALIVPEISRVNPMKILSLPIIAATLFAVATPSFAETSNPVVDTVVVFETIDFTIYTEASKIIGSKIYGAEGKEIGKVSDLLMSSDNVWSAVKVGVGGFLGIEERYVSIPVSKITFVADGKKLKLLTDYTKEDLRAAIGK